jgi:hypothetical protein
MTPHYNTNEPDEFVPCTFENAPGLFQPFNDVVGSVDAQIKQVMERTETTLICVEVNQHTHELRVKYEPAQVFTAPYAGGWRNLFAANLEAHILESE